MIEATGRCERYLLMRPALKECQSRSKLVASRPKPGCSSAAETEQRRTTFLSGSKYPDVADHQQHVYLLLSWLLRLCTASVKLGTSFTLKSIPTPLAFLHLRQRGQLISCTSENTRLEAREDLRCQQSGFLVGFLHRYRLLIPPSEDGTQPARLSLQELRRPLCFQHGRDAAKVNAQAGLLTSVRGSVDASQAAKQSISVYSTGRVDSGIVVQMMPGWSKFLRLAPS